MCIYQYLNYTPDFVVSLVIERWTQDGRSGPDVRDPLGLLDALSW